MPRVVKSREEFEGEIYESLVLVEGKDLPRHAAGISEITSMRERTSSERLLSCVDVASIVCGQRLARSALAAWKARTPTPN